MFRLYRYTEFWSCIRSLALDLSWYFTTHVASALNAALVLEEKKRKKEKKKIKAYWSGPAVYKETGNDGYFRFKTLWLGNRLESAKLVPMLDWTGSPPKSRTNYDNLIGKKVDKITQIKIGKLKASVRKKKEIHKNVNKLSTSYQKSSDRQFQRFSFHTYRRFLIIYQQSVLTLGRNQS